MATHSPARSELIPRGQNYRCAGVVGATLALKCEGVREGFAGGRLPVYLDAAASPGGVLLYRRATSRRPKVWELYLKVHKRPQSHGSVSTQVVEYIYRCSWLDGFAITTCFISWSVSCQTLKTT